LLGARALWRRVERNVRESIISPEFARRIDLAERLQRLDSHRSLGLLANYLTERAESIQHPYLTVGRERYDRVASALGIEPRDPFLDRRVIDFCVRLPGEQRLAGGWPKIILRRAMAGRLPEAVRWRRGKEHLGWVFTRALVGPTQAIHPQDAEAFCQRSGQYLTNGILSTIFGRGHDVPSIEGTERAFDAACLLVWLRQNGERASACAQF
jgi:asparagine synthetase B (glutamine-hydrolysing)